MADELEKALQILIKYGVDPTGVKTVTDANQKLSQSFQQARKDMAGLGDDAKKQTNPLQQIAKSYNETLNAGRSLHELGRAGSIFGRLLKNEDLTRLGEYTSGAGELVMVLGRLPNIIKEIQAAGLGGVFAAGAAVVGGVVAGANIYDRMIQQGGALGGQGRADAGTIIKQMLASAGASLAAGITGATLEGANKKAQVYRQTLDDTAHSYGLISDATYEASRAQYDAAARFNVQMKAFIDSIDHTAISAGEAAAGLNVMGDILKGIGLPGAGAAVARGLEVSPQFKDAAKQYADYQKQLIAIDQKGAQDRVKIGSDMQKQYDALNQKFATENAKAYQSFVDANLKAAQQLRDQQMKIVSTGVQEEQKAETQYYQQRAQQAEAFGIEMVRLEQDHQIEIQRMNQDHTIRVRRLAETRDALAIEDENQSYELERRRNEEDYQREVARKNQDFARQLADSEKQFAEQREQRQQERAQQLADLKEQYDEQQKERIQAYDQAKKERAQQYQDEHDKIAQDGTDRLNQLTQQLRDEQQSATDQWTQWRRDHQIFLTGEKALWDDYLQYTYDSLNKYLTGTATPATGIPAGVAGHQAGGYTAGGMALMHPGEFVLNAQATRAAEQRAGAALTQDRLISALDRRGAGGLVLNTPINLSLSFGGVSEPNEIKRATEEAVYEAISRVGDKLHRLMGAKV